MKAFIAKKVGMTSLIDDNGVLTPVTLLSADPNVVTQLKTEEIDGYKALQIGVGAKKQPSKPLTGHTKKAGIKIAPKIINEFRYDELPEDISVGTEIKADVFNVGDLVDVTGNSKGKGFAGTIKRHNFKRGRKTHGGRSYRRPGSIGSMYPQRIFKGKRMAGRLGNDQVTVKNLKVALVDTELKVIGVSGSIPGPRNAYVKIAEAK